MMPAHGFGRGSDRPAAAAAAKPPAVTDSDGSALSPTLASSAFRPRDPANGSGSDGALSPASAESAPSADKFDGDTLTLLPPSRGPAVLGPMPASHAIDTSFRRAMSAPTPAKRRGSLALLLEAASAEAETSTAGAAAVQPPPPINLPRSAAALPPSNHAASAAKPQQTPPPLPRRPMTAYTLFFQIEKEYIVQTMAGEDANPTIHEGKVRLPGVPRRYRHILLAPDWSAGPGKRKKRRHRKCHGKIGFHELSKTVSQRWATLEATDPETKEYVQRIARGQLEEYKREMAEYRERTRGMDLPPPVAKAKSGKANGKNGAKKKKATTKKPEAPQASFIAKV